MIRRTALASIPIAVLACATEPAWRLHLRTAEKHLRQGRLEEAGSRYEAALAAAKRAGDPRGELASAARLAELYSTHPSLERESEAKALWLEVLGLAESLFGPDHSATADVAYGLAEVYLREGRDAEAEPLYARALPVYERALGRRGATLLVARRLVETRRNLGMREEAAEIETWLAQAERSVASAAPDLGSARVALDATYLRPNVADSDGVGAYVHLSEEDMPLRVAVSAPPVPARDGSTRAAREAVMGAVRMWEEAIRPWFPWFRVEFVERDPSAPVQIQWKRRIAGAYAGFGGLRYDVEEGRLRVGGEMTITMQPDVPYSEEPLELDELRLLVAHEFGHVLGLSHCLDCDSVMSYDWQTRGRTFVTELDVLTFRALMQQPNGFRVDGRPLGSLRSSDAPP